MKEEKERLDRKRRRQDKPPVELLFDEYDADEASKLFVPLPWNEPESFKGFQFTFRPSGHILGASSIEVSAENIKLVFSGDLGPQDTVLEPLHTFLRMPIMLLLNPPTVTASTKI